MVAHDCRFRGYLFCVRNPLRRICSRLSHPAVCTAYQRFVCREEGLNLLLLFSVRFHFSPVRLRLNVGLWGVFAFREVKLCGAKVTFFVSGVVLIGGAFLLATSVAT